MELVADRTPEEMMAELREKNRVYFAEYRKNNPDKIKKAKRKYYEKNREEVIKKTQAYYFENKEHLNKMKVANARKKRTGDIRTIAEIKAYQQAYRNFSKYRDPKRYLAMRKIEPTETDIDTMLRATKAYAYTSKHYSNYEELISDGFEGLLNGIRLFDDSKGYKREAYLYAKVKYHLIDTYRSDFGRNDSPKREYLTSLSSLNVTIKSDEGETEIINLIGKEQIDPDIILDGQFFRKELRKRFIKMSGNRKRKTTGPTLFKIWEDYTIKGYTMEECGERSNVSESRVSQLMKGLIGEIFNIVQKEFVAKYGADFLLK